MCVVAITGLLAFSSQWQLPKSVCFFCVNSVWCNDQSQKLRSLRFFHLEGKADRDLGCLWSQIRLYLPYATLRYPEVGSNQTIMRLYLYWKSQSPVACSPAQTPCFPSPPMDCVPWCTYKGPFYFCTWISLSPTPSVILTLKQSSALFLLTETPLISKASDLPCFRRISILSFPIPMIYKDLALSKKLKW